jgi:hypothetical protein
MKSILPFAPGQLWKNNLYRLSDSSNLALKTNRKAFIRDVLGFNSCQPKHFMIDFCYDSIGFCNPAEKSIRPSSVFVDDFFGDPLNYGIFERVFDGTEPDGYHNSLISELMWISMRTCPLIEYTVLRNSKPIAPRQLNSEHASGHFLTSSGLNPSEQSFYRNQLGRNLHSDIMFSAVDVENPDKSILFQRDYWRGDLINFSDFLIHLSNFTDKTIGSFILPQGSVIWYLEENQNWTPCSVEYVVPLDKDQNIAKDKITVNFVEIDEQGNTLNRVVDTYTSKEVSVHKWLSKLIDSDSIRVVIKNIRNIRLSNNPFNISNRILALFLQNYNSPLLSQVKTSIFGSTEHKNLANFDDFYSLLRKSGKYLLELVKFSGSTIKTMRKLAYEAAKNKTPLFWGMRDKITWCCKNWVPEANAIRELNISTSDRHSQRIFGYNISRESALRNIYENFLRVKAPKVELSEVDLEVELKVKKIQTSIIKTSLQKRVLVPSFFSKLENTEYVKNFLQDASSPNTSLPLVNITQEDESLLLKKFKEDNINITSQTEVIDRAIDYMSLSNIKIKK